MGRLLSILLLAVLMFSHGTMSAAAPHFGEHAHHDLAGHGHDHQDLEQHEGVDASGLEGKTQPGIGHHFHVTGDSVTPAAFALPGGLLQNIRLLPTDETALRSLAVAPPLEPPSVI